jgi:hypothetical protein
MQMSSVLPGPLSAQQPDQAFSPPETRASHDQTQAGLTRSRGTMVLARMRATVTPEAPPPL